MTGSDELPDLPVLDATARAAAQGLLDHVERVVDVEGGLARLSAGPRPARRGRVLVAAAVTLLVLGGLAVASSDGRVRTDDDVPVPSPVALEPLGPRDGQESISLPVTATPSELLGSQQRVHGRGTGFVPGEQVGIVQCASEAGRTDRGGRGAGTDACDLSPYETVTADADGVAEGDYDAARFLTTPLTGTIDCSERAGRCILAMGALADYDRSGGVALQFTGGDVPGAPEVPTLSVSPSTNLTDRQLVRVTGSGYQPGDTISFQVCSEDPATCWSTGLWNRDIGTLGLVADDDGRIDGDLPVWQFLPVGSDDHYADCAVSACSLRATPNRSATPAPVPLAFEPGATPPTRGGLRIEPDRNVSPGDDIAIAASGLPVGSKVMASLCAALGPPQPDSAASSTCGAFGDPMEVRDDGTVVGRVELPHPDQLLGCEGCSLPSITPTTTCEGVATCTTESVGQTSTTAGLPEDLCDGVGTHCTLRLDVVQEGGDVPTALPPYFLPAPVPLTMQAS